MSTPGDLESAKRTVGTAAAQLVEPGMCVGLGTGSTAFHFIRALGERVRSGLKIHAVATSIATESLARAEGIVCRPLDGTVDLAIDGADAVTPTMDALKGFGGALFREKMVALAAKRFVLIVDETKCVKSLREAHRLPIEVMRFGLARTMRAIESLGLDPVLRLEEDGSPFLTDNLQYLVGANFRADTDEAALASPLKSITGVIEHGLFLGMVHGVLVGHRDGRVTRLGSP